MGTKPAVSVIIPFYNRIEVFEKAILSVICQSFSNWELILIDDGSDINCNQLAKRYSNEDARIKLIKRKKNPKGAANCRNIGITHSTSLYIIFLDSDDLLADFCLDQRLKYTQELSMFDFLVFPIQIFNKQPGDTDKVWLYHDFNDPITGFLQRAQWQTSSVLWRRSALLKLNGFDESLCSSQDADLHRMALINHLKYKIVHTKPDVYYRNDEKISGITRGGIKIENLRSKYKSFIKAYVLLEEKNNLCSIRSRLIAGQILCICLQFIKIDKQREGIEKWLNAYNSQLINNYTYTLGLLYIKINSLNIIRLPLLHQFVRKVFFILLPKYLLWKC